MSPETCSQAHEANAFVQALSHVLGIADIRCIGDGYAVFITFFFAILVSAVAFVVNAHQRKREYRYQHSSQFLATSSDDVLRAIANLNPHLSSSMTPAAYVSALNTIPDLYKNFFLVSKHFELACVYMSTGYASERIIVRVENGNMLRFFDKIRPYIAYARKSAPKTFCHFEAFYIRRKYLSFSLLAEIYGFITRDRFMAYRKIFFFYYAAFYQLIDIPKDHIEADPARIERIFSLLGIARHGIAVFILIFISVKLLAG